MEPVMSRKSLGTLGENWVAESLRRAGYEILAQNWRHPILGELDIIARRKDQIVFVEVRTRSGPLQEAVEAALASVDERKQARLIRLAEAYLAEHDLEAGPCRIDVVAVGYEDGKLSMEVIHHAVDW
jgi:putative endonuclease